MDDRSENISHLPISRSSHGNETGPPSPLLQPASERDAFITESAQPASFDSPPSTRLHRSSYILILTLLYVGLAVFAWTVTSVLAFGPFISKGYGPFKWKGGIGSYEAWYRVARTFQSVVGVSTIPLTSAVCSAAAVIFVQHRGAALGLTIRQVLVLADKGWVDPITYVRTFPGIVKAGWKRYGSSLLLLAMGLTALGGIIQPLQEILLTAKTIKTATVPQELNGVLDIPDQWTNAAPGPDSNIISVLTRSALSTATNIQPQAQLWQGNNFTCDVVDFNTFPIFNATPCGLGATFGQISNLQDPFLAQLPSGYSTGLIQQFLPRINSTAQYENISQTEYPTNCSTSPGSFYVNYSNFTTNETWWGLEACMPGDHSQSPWKATRNRQDFSEVLYMNVTLNGYFWRGESGNSSASQFYRIAVDTTAGYFELPNYMNGGLSGPLLDEDPTNGACGDYCVDQGWSIPSETLGTASSNDLIRRQSTSTDTSLPLTTVLNKGPLLTIAIALFGQGSFIPTRLASPSAFADTANSTQTGAGACIDLPPLSFLLDGNFDEPNEDGADCVTNTSGGIGGAMVDDEIAAWIGLFNGDVGTLANAFTAGAFLANQAWLENNLGEENQRTLTVSYDLGEDTVVPSISLAGLIVISVLLAVYLVALCAVAVYASRYPRWTSHLDSFAMMRIGAAVGDRVPLLVGEHVDKIAVLDEIPGWVGDETGADEEVGRLGLGAKRRLDGIRPYVCYTGDNEPLTWQEKKSLAERLKRAKESSEESLHAAETAT